jgi:ATPase subunit of ABC transporter with duplicated ATPase domains
MSLIQVRGLGVATPRTLFQDLDLTVNDADRIGLIAGNGAGKSTLLRCLAGTGEPTAGTITRRRGLRIGFVEQDVPASLLDLPLAEAVRRALPPAERAANAWKVDLALDAFATPAVLRERPLAALSGGWQRLALIARAWIAEPDLLLLDEPTNHLDLEHLVVLEDWVRDASAGVAMVIASHDRQFLDGCTTHSLFLRPDAARLYAHPFSRARALLADDDAAEAAQRARDSREAERLRRSAAHHRNVGINSGSDLWLTRAKRLNARAAEIEQALTPQRRERVAALRLESRATHAKVLVTLDDVVVAAPDGAALFRTGRLKIHQGERVVVMGANGAGKSQFVRLLQRAAAGEALAGVTLSPSAVVGYVDQQMSQLPPAETPFAFIAGTFRPGDQRCLSLLAGAGFDVDTQRRPIARLSPGQKARLGLLALRLTQPNLYLLDEPTNHVDIAGREQLEAEILEHAATAVLVSHDRFFVRAVGTRFLRIARGRLEEIDGPDA